MFRGSLRAIATVTLVLFRARWGTPLQRTFSGFPSGWPGSALLLLRALVGGAATLEAVLIIVSSHAAPSGIAVVTAALVIIMGLGLIVGFMTPLATGLLCATALLADVDVNTQSTFVALSNMDGAN